MALPNDTLVEKITTELRPGEKVTAVGAMLRWGYSDSHTRKALHWMAEVPRTLRQISGRPAQWTKRDDV